MKKDLVFLIVLGSSLGLATLALAQTSLPNPLGSVGDLPTLIKNIADFVFKLAGFLAIVMFVLAGILFLTSAGNEEQIGKAKKALLYAAVGLAIALAGAGLVALIRNILTGQ